MPSSPVPAQVHQLADSDITPHVAHVRQLMYDKFGQDEVDKRIKPYDWSRWAVAAGMLEPGGSVLDVGTGHGTFLNALAAMEQFDQIVGIDIRDYSLYAELVPGFERLMGVDAETMDFPDRSFDVVVAMEIIEHQQGDKMGRVLDQLRRVARSRLILTVPFCEPQPLPKYHFQHFDADRVRTMFPDASYTLLLKDPVTRVPWLLVDEPQRARRRLGRRFAS